MVAVDAAENLPPFRRRPDPRSDALPSPYAPKDAMPAPKAPARGTAPMANAPAQPSPAAKNLGELKALLATASSAWKNVDTYEVTITRREVNAKGDQSSEVVFCQFRREPMGVYMRTTSDAGKGREIVYTKQSDKMHVVLGEGDNRFMGAGFHAPPIGPDDPRVKEKSRYSIRDAGLSRYISVLSGAIAKLEAGRIPADAVTFGGEVKRPEYPYPLVSVTHTVRPGDEPLMPNGGTRYHFFDMKKDSPSFGLPVLVTATDAAGKELEYYLYEKFKCPAGLTDADFDPARLKKKK